MKWILILLLLGSCTYNLYTVNRIKKLSEENGRIKQRIILEQMGYEIDWDKVDSLYKITYIK